jgi:hypothetical protein
MLSEYRDQVIAKFPDPFTAYLWERSLDGPDDEAGASDCEGWHGLMGRSILLEISTGQVFRTRYASAREAREAFDAIVAEMESHDESELG